MAQETKSGCPCSSESCPRKTNCEECQKFHHANGGKTSCGK